MNARMLCGECGDHLSLLPSRPRGPMEEALARVLGARFFECIACGSRRRFWRGERDPAWRAWRYSSGPSQW
jgi:hypothetical protein